MTTSCLKELNSKNLNLPNATKKMGTNFNNQAFHGLEHYNLSETGSFLIRKLN